MKLSLLSSLLLPASLALAQAESESQIVAPPSLENVQVDVAFPGASFSSSKKGNGDTVELTNDVEQAIQIQVRNGEKEPITVAAFGGSFYEKPNKKGESKIYTNLTTTRLEATEIKPGESVNIDHSLKVNLPPYEFDLALNVLAMAEGSHLPGLAPAGKVAVSIVDQPISWFDPKLILVELILGVTLLAIGYFGSTLLMPYLEPKKAGSDKKSSKDKSSGQSGVGSSSGVNINGKGYDESWIPEQHLKQQKKRKS